MSEIAGQSIPFTLQGETFDCPGDLPLLAGLMLTELREMDQQAIVPHTYWLKLAHALLGIDQTDRLLGLGLSTSQLSALLVKCIGMIQGVDDEGESGNPTPPVKRRGATKKTTS
jgi:hypothetical protein